MAWRLKGALPLCAVILLSAAVLLTGGCSSKDTGEVAAGGSKPAASASEEPTGEAHGEDPSLPPEPAAPDLSTPEGAVRSYLAWTTYAYRIADARVALPTMSQKQEDAVKSYVEYNTGKGQVLDQTLQSITFSEPAQTGPRMTVSTHETWTYRYLSAENPEEVIDGPHEITYDVTYTLIESGDGWVVDEVRAEVVEPTK